MKNINDFPPVIVTGVYGSGKTEFCVNYALHARKQFSGGRFFLADMDVLNPYFRSREKAAFLARHGIEIIGNSLDNTSNQDVPAISGDVLRAVLSREKLLVDLAGSVHGLKTLTFFKDHLKEYSLWVVLNAFREESSSAEKMAAFIEQAESGGGLRVNGIIHNSHMLRETTADDVLYGQELVLKVSGQTGIKIVYTFIQSSIYEEIKTLLTSPVIIFDRLIMREDWQ